MNASLKKFILAVSFVLFSSYNFLQGQSVSSISDSLYRVMLAFPGQFHSLKGESAFFIDPNAYYSTLFVPGIWDCLVMKNPDNGSWEWQGTITDSNDEEDEDEMEKTFKKWKATIDNMTLGGVRLVSYKDNRYTTENTDKFYEEGYAWRLDNSRNNIDARYRKFTIRLECIHEDDYLEVRLLISDN